MKPTVNFSLLLFYVTISIVLLTSCEQKSHKPNVVLIMADDQGWGDLRAHGNQLIHTPKLDQLKSEGVSFERFFVSPLCAPTRASLLTGRYHTKTGTIGVTKGLERMNTDEFTLAEAFQQNGYVTGIFGKWHNGEHFPENPLGQGFDEFVGFCAGHWNNYFDSQIQEGSKMTNFKGYLPDYLTEKAIDFISRNKTEPFFCYIPYNTPHTPHQVPDLYYDKYKAKGLDDELAAIYGMVENLDDNIGKVLNFLEDENLRNNTVVIYMSDNGPNGTRFNGGMKGKKGQVHEGGVRSPLFISQPGTIPKNKSVKQLAAHLDLFPTLIDLCQLKTVETTQFDGMNLSPFLLHNPTTTEREIYSLVTYQLTEENKVPDQPGSLRTNNFRWIKQNNQYELYDMLNDPSEKNNLIDSLPELHRVFRKKYKDWFDNATSSTDVMSRSIIPIGYKSIEEVTLQAPQASFTGNVKFFEGHGWANDWLTNWTQGDKISWQVKVHTKTDYKIYLKYTCSNSQVGSEIRLKLNNEELHFSLQEAFDPSIIPSPDRVKRKEAYEKPWKNIPIGTLTFEKGIHQVTLTAKNTTSFGVGDIKGLVLVQ